MKFDVSTERWIPVIREDGTPDELSLRDVLTQAHHIRAIVDSMPTVEFGLHRLLVAFVLDIFQPKKIIHWTDLWEAKNFDYARVEKYFADNADCFDLFDAEKPFLQTAKVTSPKPKPAPKMARKPRSTSADEDKDLRKPVAVLLPSLPTGVNVLHFHHHQEEDLGVGAAAAARLLTAVGPFAINVGPGPGGSAYHMPSSLNGTRQVFILPTGRSLWETLLFNTPVQRQALKTNWGEEIPAWRDATSPKLELKEKVGLVEGLTWRPRQVRLLVGEEGICDLTGKLGPLVRQVLWAQGFSAVERLTKEEKEEKKKSKEQRRVLKWQDPNIAYFTVDESRKTVTAEEGKEFWRDTAPLLFLQKSDGPKQRRLPDGRVRMALFERPAIVDQWANIQSNASSMKEFACNLYYLSTSDAKVEEWQSQQLSVRAPLIWNARLHNEAQAAMEEAEKVFYCLKWAIKKAHRQFAGFNSGIITQKVAAGESLPASTDKKNPSRYYVYLRRIENAGLMYWRDLRPYYDRFLDVLAEEHEEAERKVARQQWLDQVRDVGWKTLEFALDDLDGTAEGLERQTKAYQLFRRAIFTTVAPDEAQAKKDATKKRSSTPPASTGSQQLSLPNI